MTALLYGRLILLSLLLALAAGFVWVQTRTSGRP
jgi:hypothetical protein